MKVLVIPDIHLKPFMFKQAAELMERGIAQRVVCLMDIPDDWDKQFNILFYEETYEEAIRFAKKYVELLKVAFFKELKPLKWTDEIKKRINN